MERAEEGREMKGEAQSTGETRSKAILNAGFI